MQVEAALKACSGSLERAADWLFSHSDDLDAAVASVNAPAAPPGQQPSAAPASAGALTRMPQTTKVTEPFSSAVSCCATCPEAPSRRTPVRALHSETSPACRCSLYRWRACGE